MIKKNLFILFILISFNNYGQTWEFINSFGGPEQDNGEDVAIDKSGNIYITGSFDDTAYFGLDTVISHGEDDWDIFTLKLNPNGEVLWVRAAGGSYWAADRSDNIVVDDNNNCYIAGEFYDTAQFDTITLNGSTYGSAFIASYDTYGNLRWAKPITSTNYIRIKDLEINKNNTLYITGYFSGNANIDNNIISSTGEDFYFAVLDTSANANLVVKNDSHNSAAGLSIMTDNESNIYLGGHFYDTLTISVDTIFNNSIRAKSFLAKYDSIGNYLWSKKIGGDNFGEASISDIKIDANNRIFISGNFSNKLYFMSDSIDGNPSDFFLAKTTNNGQLIWLRGGGGTSSDQCYAIDIDSKSNIYLAGSITDTIHCGAITLNADGTEVFIAKCDSSGNFIWADHSSTTIISRAYGISTDFDDYVYLTGFYRETIELGPFSLTTGLPDIFIAKINSHTMIEEVSNKDNNLLVYPNPSNNIITLNVNKNDIDLSNSVAYIYNNYGQLETMCEITKTTNVIDVSDLSNGIHFLVIRDDSTTISNKFIKN